MSSYFAKTDESGRSAITGADAPGQLSTGNPLLIGGVDGTNAVRTLSTNADGQMFIVGTEIDGAPLQGHPVLAAGSDGTNAKNLLTDASGRQIIVGAGAAGAAETGNPMLTAGSDGTNARTLLTDNAGRQVLTGAEVDGQPLASNPVLIAGSDGANAHTLLTDGSARLIMVGAEQNGTAPSGNALLIAGFDGTHSHFLNTNHLGNLQVNGPSASGAALDDNNPVLTAGTDGTSVLTLSTDDAGRQIIVGTSAVGAGVTGNPVSIGCKALDGTSQFAMSDNDGYLITNNRGYDPDGNTWQNLRTDASGATVTTSIYADGDEPLVTLRPHLQGLVAANGIIHTALGDANGRQIIVGGVASGAAASVNPVLVAGCDGTDARFLSTDTEGRQVMVGAGATGAALTGNPVLIAGSDGTNALNLSTDATGRLAIVGAGAADAALVGNPVLMAGSDGTNARALSTDTAGNQIIVGATAYQDNVTGNPVTVGFKSPTGTNLYGLCDTEGHVIVNNRGYNSDGLVWRNLRTDDSGATITTSVYAVGDTSENPLRPYLQGVSTISGVVQAALGDSTGRQIIVGAAAAGSAADGNPVLIAGSDGTLARNMATDTSGRQIIVGAASDGATAVGNPVLIAGIDGSNNVATLSIDATGSLGVKTNQAENAVSSGSLFSIAGQYNNTPRTIADGRMGAIAVSSEGHVLVDINSTSTQIYGTDGATNQAILTSSAGNILVGGVGAAGSAVAGNPVLIAGSDGTNARNLSTDASGRQVMVGAGAAGSAVAGNPVLNAGSDGTNARNLLTDTSGRQVMVGAASNGGTVTGNPVLVGGSDGSNTYRFKTDTQGAQIVRQMPDYSFYMHGEASGAGAQLILTPSSGVYTPTTFRSQGGSQFPNYFVIVSSDNGNKNGIGGLQRITIEGYQTSGGTFTTETINLNGTTPVTTVNAYNAILRITSTYGNIIAGSTVTVRPDDFNTTLSYLEITDSDVYNPVFYSVNGTAYCTHISISSNSASTFSMWRVNCDDESRSVVWRRKFNDTFDFEMEYGPSGAFRVYNNEYIVVMNEGTTNTNTTFSIRFDVYKN